MTSIMRFDQWQNSLGQNYGTILQVVQVHFGTGTAYGSGEFTLMSANITPKMPNSKIMISAIVTHGINGTSSNNDSWDTGFAIKRGTTRIGTTDAALRTGGVADAPASYGTDVPFNAEGSVYRLTYETIQRPFNYLDSPTYTVGQTINYSFVGYFGTAGWINRSSYGNYCGGVSSFTLMEVAQ